MNNKVEHNRGDDVNALNELRLSIEYDPNIAYKYKREICEALQNVVGLITKYYNIKNI